jgi:NADPH:quinone reductase-like Zn-dependent oxidoreductase
MYLEFSLFFISCQKKEKRRKKIISCIVIANTIIIIMGNVWGQLFPPKPHFTEKEIPSLEGKVFIVTGGNSGVGLEIVKILYARGGTVYMAGRSATKIDVEIEAIKAATLNPTGQLKNLVLDLSDLTTIKPAVDAFFA